MPPLPAELEVQANKKPVEVLVLEQSGVIIRSHSYLAVVGAYYNLSFKLPNLDEPVRIQTRAVKTYDRGRDRLAELQFQNLTDDLRKRIVAYKNSL